MKKSILVSVLMITIIHARSEWELATIADPDGFTLVRAEKGTSFQVIDTVRNHEFFYCEPISGDWWSVNTFHGEQGYIHKSRVRFIKQYPDASKASLIRSILKEHKMLADKFDKIWRTDQGRTAEAMRKLSDHHEYRFAPILDIFAGYFCKNKDTVMLKYLFDTLWTYTGSADETPSFAVGKIYICQPDLVLAVWKKLPKDQREHIAAEIDWGLENHFYDDQKNTKFLNLQKKLDKARKG